MSARDRDDQREGVAPWLRWRSVTPRRLTALLTPVGVVCTHLLAYVLPHAEPGTGVTHHHLAPLALVTVLLALGALGAVAVRAARGNAVELRLGVLAAAQAALYAAVEVPETLLGGGSLLEAVTAPTLRSGLLVQLVVAWALVRVVRVTVAVGQRLSRQPRALPLAPAPVWHCSAPRQIGRRHHLTPATRRGPPQTLISA